RRHHAGHGHPDRAGPRLQRRREAADPDRPLSRRRSLHGGHRSRGDPDPRGRRPCRRAARAGHARAPEGLSGHGARAQRALGPVARVRAQPHRGVKQEVRPVPLSGPFLDEREEELVVEVMRSGRLSLGPMVDRFEEAFAEKVGVPYAAAVSSGTAGLHLLCIAAGIAPGDEVITTPYSFAATANCFIYEGGVPVFADVDPRTLNMDPRAVEAALTERTKAIVAVDIFGYPCELDELRTIADRHGLALILDSCEALGATYKGALVGSHGPSAVFAFYPNKQITTGEGGMVTTRSADEWRVLRSLRNQGRGDSGGW